MVSALHHDYVPGVCNIGPAEIARRRWTGHVGAAITLAGLGAVLLAQPPDVVRLGLFVPAAVSAGGYIQAATRFCADYGWRGVVNFGRAGHGRATSVADQEARRSDRRTALRIGAGSALVGAAVTALSLVL